MTQIMSISQSFLSYDSNSLPPQHTHTNNNIVIYRLCGSQDKFDEDTKEKFDVKKETILIFAVCIMQPRKMHHSGASEPEIR